MQNEQELQSGLTNIPASAMAAFEPPPSRDPRPRYLFFGGDMPYTHNAQYPTGGLWVESRCVSNQICLRCDITPVLLTSPRAQIEYIPEGMGIPGTEIQAGPGPIKLALQQYYEYPGPVVTNLVKNYGDRGLVELEALRGFNPATVKTFALRQFFFPDWPELPKDNRAILELLDEKLDQYRALAAEDPAAAQVIISVGETMFKSVRTYDDWMQATIDETHARFTLGGEDTEKKRRYDRLDNIALERTATARRDNELNIMARQSNQLSQALKDAFSSIVSAQQTVREAIPQVEANITPEQLQTIMQEQNDRLIDALDQQQDQFETMMARMAAVAKANGLDIVEEPAPKRSRRSPFGEKLEKE